MDLKDLVTYFLSRFILAASLKSESSIYPFAFNRCRLLVVATSSLVVNHSVLLSRRRTLVILAAIAPTGHDDYSFATVFSLFPLIQKLPHDKVSTVVAA